MTIEQALATLRAEPTAAVEAGALLGTGLADGYTEYDSPLGAVTVSFNLAGVTGVRLAGEEVVGRRPLVRAIPPRGWDARIGRAIERGTPGDLPVDLGSVTTFQRQVLLVAATIPRGEVRPYGWLAREVGHPGAVRAVGSAMARNPVPLIIPCHRVVRSDGMIGNYSLGGPDNKVRLLRLEGADPAGLEHLARRRLRFLGSDATLVYCQPTCRRARRIRPAHLIGFPDAETARAAGYSPCPDCRP
jgi:O-6-methylguanine DNA methyltransferase